MDPENTGLLIRVEGKVSDVIKTGNNISQFTVTDSSGKGALVYINAYITDVVELDFVEEGATVSVVGLASIGENQSGEPGPRIRVRDRAEIVFVSGPINPITPGGYDDSDDSGSSNQVRPPQPNVPDRDLTPDGDGYLENDEDGVPLGRWEWDAVEEEWVFEEFEESTPPLSDFPRTGDSNAKGVYVMLLVLSVTGMCMLLIVADSYKPKRQR